MCSPFSGVLSGVVYKVMVGMMGSFWSLKFVLGIGANVSLLGGCDLGMRT